MSEHYATIITIHKEPHPNAEKLFIQMVAGNNVLVLSSNDWKEGQLAVHIEPDYEVYTKHKAFEWLAPQCKAGQEWYKVGVRTMRGVDSFGLAVPLSELGTLTEDSTQLSIDREPWNLSVNNGSISIDNSNLIRRWENPRENTDSRKLCTIQTSQIANWCL